MGRGRGAPAAARSPVPPPRRLTSASKPTDSSLPTSCGYGGGGGLKSNRGPSPVVLPEGWRSMVEFQEKKATCPLRRSR